MNRVEVSGRLTNDPEMRTFSKNRNDSVVEGKVASFTLAIDVVAGRKQDEALFLRCAAFDGIANIIEEHVKKGNKIIAEGHLKGESYTKDDKKIYAIKLIIDNVEFCDSKIKNEVDNNEGFVDIPKGQLDDALPTPF